MTNQRGEPEATASGSLDLFMVNVFLIGCLVGSILQGGVIAWAIERVIG